MGYRELINIIVKITLKKVRRLFAQYEIEAFKNKNKYSNISYAQEGEDLVLDRFLNNKSKGFFIDVGAHHPKRFSNTYKFYLKGWRGINIDAMPESMDLFEKFRPADINLEAGVSKVKGELTYYIFNEPALNTFSKEEAIKKDGLRDYKIIKKIKIDTLPLSELLDEHVKINTKIDFMTIDVEGLDLEVIESNDWEKYRPNFILIEDLKKYDLKELATNSEVFKSLESKNYILVAKTFNTLFFKDKLI